MASLLSLITGLAMLIGGGTLLVRGASAVAAAYGVSPMIVGLTIVGFGTSMPELVVNVIGAINGETGLAFGNVAGSNIANLSLVLGAAAVFSAMSIQSQLVLREVPLLLLAITSITVMALDGLLDGGNPVLSRSDGLVLLLLFGIFIYITVLDFLRTREPDPLLESLADNALVTPPPRNRWRWLETLAGLVLLTVGGQLTISGGSALADSLGISATIVGLFAVAVGTSMPELVTSIIAAMRGDSDLALGNVVGSNLFNSLLVLPVTAVVSPVAIPSGGVLDLILCWVLAAALIPLFVLGNARLGRGAGVVLLLGYAIYAALRISAA